VLYMRDQSGVALLQVLLISLIISLISLQFTFTARDHVQVAREFDQRVTAQLLAYSAFNEIIFIQLSETVVKINAGSDDLIEAKERLNLFGKPISWNDDVSLVVQDLNGLLPQRYPQHILWERVLRRLGMEEDAVKIYLGRWTDMQDPDIISWRNGESEPVALPSGELYLNGFAQTEHPLRWIFGKEYSALDTLLSISDVDATYETNILNAPDILIDAIFEPEIAINIKNGRENGAGEEISLNDLLPRELKVDYIYQHQSPYRRVTVTVDAKTSGWTEEWHVMLNAAQKPPFRILRKK
jgi:hypothetical protein